MTDRPNVVMIMADQWRGDCLSVAGHPDVRTPFLDRLAQRGARFRYAYSATPTCTPARASLMTGLRPASHGRVGFEDHIPWDYPTTLAGEFTAAGYQTQAVGKMHFSPERAQVGFQNVILHSPLGIIRSTRQAGRDPDDVDDYLPWLRQQLGRDATFFEHGVDSNSWVARPWDKPEYTHSTNWVAAQSADFLRRRDPSKPFLLFTSFNAPHPPYDPPAWAFEQYLSADLTPASVGDWSHLFDDRADRFNPTSPVGDIDSGMLHRARAGYYGHMTHVDQQINFLLEELWHRGLRENTYICFVSDHGELLGDHHLFRKGMPYEGAARIPMLLSGPGITPGTVVDDVVELGDVMPTLLDYAGIEVPAVVEGRSARELLDGDRSSWRDYLHGEHVSLGQSFQFLTDGREKYIWMSESGTEQLFDLTVDPQELHDLAADPAAANRLSHWRARLVTELADRPEGFVSAGRLMPGRPVAPTLHTRRGVAVAGKAT